jgi:hypothetical protein
MGENHRMNTVVFFTKQRKLEEALHQFPIEDFQGQQVPVKLHMGEMNNKFYPKPALVKQVVTALQNVGADPFLFDTTVAYNAPRRSVSGYKKVATLHGFTKRSIGCDIIIDDTGVPVNVEGRAYDVADHLFKATHLFGLSHVKGHIATGMGGAIKNLGMGGVTKETKLRMHHGSRPEYQQDACTFCGVCAEVCPFEAITVQHDSWKHHMNSCFGCGVCVDACTNNALQFMDADLQFVLACAAKACVQDKTVLYFNELKRISRSCDCDPDAGPLICPDIGYLVSDDPVAIDKASLDLIYDIKENVFEKVNHVSPLKQIKYGEEIGLGSSSYHLVEL